jgi:hypothetical protein
LIYGKYYLLSLYVITVLILQTGREYIGWFLAVSPYVVIK